MVDLPRNASLSLYFHSMDHGQHRHRVTRRIMFMVSIVHAVEWKNRFFCVFSVEQGTLQKKL